MLFIYAFEEFSFDFEKDFIETLSWILLEIQPKDYQVLTEMKIDLKHYSFKDIKVILIPSLVGRFKGDPM